ncbi:Coiled-coil domain-containing protein 18, partial [Exaiptasia diaphana]
EADKLRKRKQESEETNQELRLAREQLQTTHAELIEARRDLLKYQSREQELIHELDDAHTLLNAKEHDCTRLAKDLGASQVREAEAEARCVQEMRKTQQQHEIKQVSQEHELKRLQESHAKLLSQREELQAEKNLAINKLKDTNQQLTRELADYKDANSHLSQETKQLTNQLTGYQDELKSVNESMVIKEAEITRLEARISGYERAMFGTRQHFDRLGANSPRPSPALRAHVRHVTSPRALTDLKKSSSDHNLHNLSESSAYSILDTDDFIHSLDHVIERGRSHTPLEVPSLLTRRQDLSSTKTSQTAAKYEKDNLDAVPESDLDPSQCRASLKEKLRASEERRKQIDKQLHTMKSSIS